MKWLGVDERERGGGIMEKRSGVLRVGLLLSWQCKSTIHPLNPSRPRSPLSTIPNYRRHHCKLLPFCPPRLTTLPELTGPFEGFAPAYQHYPQLPTTKLPLSPPTTARAFLTATPPPLTHQQLRFSTTTCDPPPSPQQHCLVRCCCFAGNGK